MTTVLFDATRLITRTEREAPTGVDRVCLAYAEWLIGLPGVCFEPVRSRQGALYEVDAQWFRHRIAELRQRWSFSAHRPSKQEEILFRVLADSKLASGLRTPLPTKQPSVRRRWRVWNQALRTRRSKAVTSGIYFNVGHSGLEQPALLANLAARGVKPFIFLHDLIPVTHPEYCRSGDGERHHHRVLTALHYSAYIVVNSEYTAQELRSFALRAAVKRTPEILVAPLGLEPVFSDPATYEPFTVCRPFFVYVGTIEARKNLAFLLTLWSRLAANADDATPQLVLVGRNGWENEAVLDLLERAPNLQKVVHHVADLSDTAVARLMRGAAAVLAPSMVEGYDLPALEASALGVPLIASDIPVHRELTPHATLVDPIDGPGWLRAINEQLSGKTPHRTAPKTPTWDEHFQLVEAFCGVTDRTQAAIVAPSSRWSQN